MSSACPWFVGISGRLSGAQLTKPSIHDKSIISIVYPVCGMRRRGEVNGMKKLLALLMAALVLFAMPLPCARAEEEGPVPPVTEAPGETAPPIEPTDAPAPAATPVPSEEPIPTAAPYAGEDPTPTPTPEQTEAPDPTPAPEQTEAPDPAPTPE